MKKLIRFKMIFALFCGALLISCGGSDEAEVAPEEGDVTEVVVPNEGTNQAPKISRIWFDPATPVPGGVLRVKSDVRDPDGDSLTMSYAWRINGRAAMEGGDLVNLESRVRGDR